MLFFATLSSQPIGWRTERSISLVMARARQCWSFAGWIIQDHVVFCPKYRRKVLVNGVDVRLKELIHSIADENNFDVIEMEIMPDHVHLLLEVDPQFGIHKAVKTIKGKTSRILRQEFHWLTTKLPTLWTNSYFCSTVGGAPLEIVRQYIESQKTSQRKWVHGNVHARL